MKYIYKIDVPQALVAIGLVVSLIISLFHGNTEQLSMCIASGLIGYIGGNVAGFTHKMDEKKPNTSAECKYIKDSDPFHKQL